MRVIKGLTGRRLKEMLQGFSPTLQEMFTSVVADLLSQVGAGSSTTEKTPGVGDGSVTRTMVTNEELAEKMLNKLRDQARLFISEQAFGLLLKRPKKHAESSPKPSSVATGGSETPTSGGEPQPGNSPTESSDRESHKDDLRSIVVGLRTDSNDAVASEGEPPYGSPEESVDMGSTDPVADAAEKAEKKHKKKGR